MGDNNYLDHCEEMWKGWINSESHYSSLLNNVFQMDYCPEPYLYFFSNSLPHLHFLTTNPGSGMAHQKLQAILEDKSVVNKNHSYYDNAKSLADFYSTRLKGNARVRVEAMKRLSTLSGSQGFTQVECIPYHSKNLPNKRQVIKYCEQDRELSKYIALLTSYLSDKDVVAVSAVGSASEIACTEEYFSDWLHWQGQIMGFSFQSAEKHDIVFHKETGRVTGALLLSRKDDAKKAFFLMMGSNSLPGPEGVRKIADILSR